MIKIIHKTQAETLNNLPVEVIAKVVEIATILDDSYGIIRHETKDLGGYILVVQGKEDLKEIEESNLGLYSCVPEFVDCITCSNNRYITK